MALKISVVTWGLAQGGDGGDAVNLAPERQSGPKREVEDNNDHFRDAIVVLFSYIKYKKQYSHSATRQSLPPQRCKGPF